MMDTPLPGRCSSKEDTMDQRKELAADRHDLPSRYWEPQPDEEDIKRMEQENTETWMDGEPLPFE